MLIILTKMLTKTFVLPATLAFSLMVSLTVNAADTAKRQEQPTPSPSANKIVKLSYGEGFSFSAAKGIEMALTKQGCQVELNGDGLFENAIDVEVGDKWETFETSGSAGSYALSLCKP